VTRRSDKPDSEDDPSRGRADSTLNAGRGLPEVITIAIARRLRELRAERQLSQRESARKMGISQAALSQLEAGAKLPSLATLLKIQIAYDLGSLEQIFGDLPSQILTRRPRESPDH
jgi:DNA-binding XRE family transcriptional regulator